MDHSSSDVSDSEIEEYTEKPYKQLKDGSFKVRGLNGTLRCPFCPGKKKQEYKYKDLLQHAIGVAKGSVNRNAKQKANHLALSKYLQDCLGNEFSGLELLVNSKPAVQTEEKNEELYVFPWTGIIVNITGKKDGSGFPDSSKWLKEFARHKPSEVLTFWNGKDPTAKAIVIFAADMNGFLNGAEFEKGFEKNGFGKKGWRNAQRTRLGLNIFGWWAREEDYNSPGPIGEYLRENGKLTMFSEIVKEANQRRKIAVTQLVDQIDATNDDLYNLEYQYNEKAASLNRILEEKPRLHKQFREDSRRLQIIARDNIKRILADQDKLSSELEIKKKKIDSWSKELDDREAQLDREWENLGEKKRKMSRQTIFA